jgi:hypothetical protein
VTGNVAPVQPEDRGQGPGAALAGTPGGQGQKSIHGLGFRVRTDSARPFQADFLRRFFVALDEPPEARIGEPEAGTRSGAWPQPLLPDDFRSDFGGSGAFTLMSPA